MPDREPNALPPAAEPRVTPSRPRWLTITRRIVAFALLPIAISFAAWPVVLLGGYRVQFVLDDGMSPAFEKGSMAILRYSGNFSPVRGRAYGIRLGSPTVGQVTRIRRVLALPGDRVRLESGKAIVNDQAVAEPYVSGEPGPTLPGEDTERAGVWRRIRADGTALEIPVEGGALVLPDGMCLVLPDDRKELLDPSEYLVVPTESVAAEVVLPVEEPSP